MYRLKSLLYNNIQILTDFKSVWAYCLIFNGSNWQKLPFPHQTIHKNKAIMCLF